MYSASSAHITWSSDTTLDTNELLNEIEQDIIQARNANSLWRDTEKLFLTAKSLAEEGKEADAQIQLQEVQFQIKAAKEQLNKQKGKDIVPYYLK